MYRSRFGSSVSISGDGSIVAVGARDALDGFGVTTGAVYLYSMDSVYDGGGGTGIDGNISESLTDSIGVRGLATTTRATLLRELFGSESADDEYGASIALFRDGRRLVVGARSENNEQNGAIRIYERGEEDEGSDGVEDAANTNPASATTNSWTLMEKGLIHGQNPSERAGWAVSISSDGNGEFCTECRVVPFFSQSQGENTMLILYLFLTVVANGLSW